MENCGNEWYNFNVVSPIPGNGRRCSDGSCDFLFSRRCGWCSLPLHHQMVRWRPWGQRIAWRVLCRRKKKRRSPGLCWNTVRGFVLCPDGLVISFLPIGIIAYVFLFFNMQNKKNPWEPTPEIFQNAKNRRKKTGNLFLISCLGVLFCMYGGYSVFSWLQFYKREVIAFW